MTHDDLLAVATEIAEDMRDNGHQAQAQLDHEGGVLLATDYGHMTARIAGPFDGESLPFTSMIVTTCAYVGGGSCPHSVMDKRVFWHDLWRFGAPAEV